MTSSGIGSDIEKDILSFQQARIPGCTSVMPDYLSTGILATRVFYHNKNDVVLCGLVSHVTRLVSDEFT
jgi:hypothetical protein